MAVIPTPILDYTDEDFDSFNARFDSMIDQVFPTWTERNKANFGVMLKEMFAFAMDVPAFYMDNQAKEAFLVAATERKNLIALAKQLGFEPFGIAAAEVDVTFTLAIVPVNDVIIPAGSIVRSKEVTNVLRFRLLEDVTILALADPPIGIGTVRNAEERQTTITATGLPSQEVSLDATPVIDDNESIAVQAANGLFDERRNFLGSRVTDRHFVLVVDQNDRGKVRFGNGTNGEIPQGTIIIDYEIGGGVAGNVEPDSLTRLEGTFTDILAVPVQISTTNIVDASGGIQRQSNQSIKEQAPESLRVLTRTVAREDYEIAAVTKVTEVSRALHLTSDDDLAIAENRGSLFLLGDTGEPNFQPTTVSQNAKDDVAAIFTTRFDDGGLPKTVTFQVEIFDGVFKVINIFAVVFLLPGFNASAVKTDILTNLTQFFAVVDENGVSNPQIDFGFNLRDNEGNPAPEIPWSDVHGAVRNTAGVRKTGDSLTEFTLNGLHADVPILLREFPKQGTVTLIDGDTGQELPDPPPS